LSSSIQLNHFALGHQTYLFPSNFYYNALFDIRVLFILFTSPNHCNHFYSINKLWILTSSLKILFLILLPALLRNFMFRNIMLLVHQLTFYNCSFSCYVIVCRKWHSKKKKGKAIPETSYGGS
jgi:hypothetical protein